MQLELASSLKRLEDKKNALLLDLTAWPSHRLRFQPCAESWSVLHVLDHLIKVEQAAAESLTDNLPDGHAVQIKERVGALAVFGVMRSPIRIKVPSSVAAVVPAVEGDIDTIASRWTSVRSSMTDAFGCLSSTQLRRGFFRHPVSGWMTPALSLTFLYSHLKHHDYQIARLRKATAQI